MVSSARLSTSASPRAMLASLIAHRGLIANLVRREVAGRYRGSMLGLLWSILNPVLMLAVYTFVFSEVFKTRWIGGSGSRTEFALVLFAGLMVFNFFAECVNRSPALILGNVNFVKKVVFPLEILSIVALGSAAFHLGISLLVWSLFYVVTMGAPPATVLLLPVVLAPLLVLTLGLSWLLAAVGVFLRDVTQVIGVVVMVLMFLSPVFFPVASLAADLQPFFYLSPVTVAIEQARDVMVWGHLPGWATLGAYTAVAMLVAWIGFAFFQKTRRGFADVL